MIEEQDIAAAVGLLTAVAVVKSIWNLVVSYEYPLNVKGDRWQEIRYSAAERFDWRRLVVLVVVLPGLSAVLAYVFVVGLREVFF